MQRRILSGLRLPPPGLIAAVLFLFSGAMASLVIAQAYVEHRNHLSLRELADARAVFESSLNASLNLTTALVAHLEIADHFDEAAFHRIAERLLAERSLVRNLSVVEGTTVIAVHPVAGNEAVIGVGLAAVPVQGEAALRTLATGQPTLAGPVELIQGGIGLVHRVPIFRPIDAPLKIRPTDAETTEEVEDDPPRARSADGRAYVWGLVSTPFRYDALLSQPVIAEWLTTEHVAIRGRHGLGEDGEVFYGDPAVFDHPRVQTATVHLPGGRWILGVVPRINPSPVAWLAILTPIGLGAVLAITLWIRARNDQALQQRLAASEARYQRLAEQLPEVVFLTDEGGRVQYLNSAWTRRTGLSTARFIGQPWSDLLDPRDRDAVKTAVAEHPPGGATFERDVRIVNARPLRRDAGPPADDDPPNACETTWSLLRVTPVAPESRQPPGAVCGDRPRTGALHWTGRCELIGILIDFNALKHRQDWAEYAAQHDPLTGLGNRRRLEHHFEALTRGPPQPLALIYIDLDRFKPVNDRLGHDAGDEVLRVVAQRIRWSLRPGDVAVRLGGGEFAALLALQGVEPTATEALDDVTRRLIGAIEQPIHVHSEAVAVGASHGVAWYPRDGVDLVALQRVADAEMYRRKARRRHRYRS